MDTQPRFHPYLKVLQPSFSSGALVVFVALATILTLLTPNIYQNSEYEQYFETLSLSNSSGYEKYQTINTSINTSELAADLSVFIVWMTIGLIAYAIVSSFAKLIVDLRRVMTEVEHFKQERNKIIREVLLRLTVRLAAVIVLYGLCGLFISRGVAYLLLFANAALTEQWAVGIWNIVLMTLLVGLTTHAVIVLLRIALLRVRIFFDRYFAVEE